ncbi:MAG: acyl dehydratase, partial [Candidatus Competibacter sp.]
TPAPTTPVDFPWIEHPVVDIPLNAGGYPSQLTGPNTYFEDFSLGDLIVHANGRTITDEHMYWTYLVGNTHPLHFDLIYSTGLSGKMSGDPIVYGGLVYAWLEGLASRDVSENAVWELGFTEGYHTQPSISGDTVAALSRVVATETVPNNDAVGIVAFQFIGVKNISAAAALETYGADLFIKENDKQKLSKEKLSNKIFEIERRLLIKRRPA